MLRFLLLGAAAGLALGACAPQIAAPRAPIERYFSVIDPGGEGPRAAALLVPGCDGNGPHVAFAAEKLARDGFVVLTFDYPAAYGLDGDCTPAQTATLDDDIVRAAASLRGHNGVDPARVHLVGWAEGGAGIMAALGDPTRAGRIAARSAAAFYPVCATLSAWRIDVPFLMLLADSDGGAPAQACIALTEGSKGADKVLAIRYGGAAPRFDVDAKAAAWRFWRRGADAFNGPVRDAALGDLRIFFGVPKTP
ncbi:MAG: hypothetical protein JNL71_15835 [Rhodospirillales bacterium]|nr:hypothetical protein [Rhodospirillales bacterium]